MFFGVHSYLGIMENALETTGIIGIIWGLYRDYRGIYSLVLGANDRWSLRYFSMSCSTLNPLQVLGEFSCGTHDLERSTFGLVQGG